MNDFIEWALTEFSLKDLIKMDEQKFLALYWYYGKEGTVDDYIEFKGEVYSRVRWSIIFDIETAGVWGCCKMDNDGKGFSYDIANDILTEIMANDLSTRNEAIKVKEA